MTYLSQFEVIEQVSYKNRIGREAVMDDDVKSKTPVTVARFFYRIGVTLLFFFAAIGVFFTVSVGRFACQIAANSDRTLDVSKPEIVQNIGKFAGITFPDTVVWEHAHSSSWMDTTICCKFRASKRDIEKMLADRTLTWSDTDQNQNSLIGCDKEWFDPDSITTFQSGFYDAMNADPPHEYPFLKILYDNSDALDMNKLRVVYLVVFTT